MGDFSTAVKEAKSLEIDQGNKFNFNNKNFLIMRGLNELGMTEELKIFMTQLF
jgi:hypothetical protein